MAMRPVCTLRRARSGSSAPPHFSFWRRVWQESLAVQAAPSNPTENFKGAKRLGLPKEIVEPARLTLKSRTLSLYSLMIRSTLTVKSAAEDTASHSKRSLPGCAR